MTEEQARPLEEARELVGKLRLKAVGDTVEDLATLARLLDDAQRRGDDQPTEALRQEMDDLIQTNAQVVSVMVHEIRVPMTSIRGYSDMLRNNVVGELNEMQMQFVETIRSNVIRMEHLVTDISDISKLRSGRIRLEPKIDMYKNVALEVEKKVSELAAEHQHVLTFETPSGLPLLNTDGPRLAQVLEKLVRNALNYTAEGGQITVRAEDVDGKLKVSVVDSGFGMSEDDQAHIGELFWRADDERVRAVKGHGLGLPIVIGMLELMGGEFFYESALDEGSTFGFIVPGMS